MIITLTAKLKLQTTTEQFQALRRTQVAYRDALNYVSRYAFAHGKMSNKVDLQDGTYRDIRTRFGLPAQMACSVPRQVGATYKTLWTKVKANTAARQAGHTKKRYKGLDQPPKYVSPTLTYQLGHDYSFKTEQRVSILTLDGRVIVPYTGYVRHAEAIAAQRHSFSHPALDCGERARETVEARSQPCHQSAHCGRLPARTPWPGGPDPYPRTDPAPA